MINTIYTILKMLVAILPFVVLCFLSRRDNLPKPERSKQLLMPVVAVVYSLVCMFLMNSICEWLINLIDKLPSWFEKLAAITWMPAFLQSVLQKIGSVLQSIFAGLNMNFWVFFIANAVIIAVYLLLKRVLIGIMKKAVKTDSALHTNVAGVFYEYFPGKGVWCIKDNYVQARDLLHILYIATIVILCVAMIVSRKFYYNGLIKTVFFPAFGIIILGELFFYLDGLSKEEYLKEVLGEDEESFRVVNYVLLRGFLRSLFKDKLLSENTSINTSLENNITNDELIVSLESHEDRKRNAFGVFAKRLNEMGVDLDQNYLNSALDLMDGKSILFNNPFYYDLIPYAFYPMNRALLSHKKVLVILGRHDTEEDAVNWLEEGVESITNLPFLWNIKVLSADRQPNVDIGVITRSDVLNIDLHNANADFFANVGFVMILEPSKLISTAQIGLNLIIRLCGAGEEKEIVYCLCDKNCDGLVDAMSHILMTNITEVSATKKHAGTMSYMCWNSDGERLHHRMLPNISRYLGLGTELSFAALKNQVSKTRWFGGDAFPVTDIKWIDKQYYFDLMKYAGLPTTQDAMDLYFQTHSNVCAARQYDNAYLTVEDEAFNMFEVLRDFSTRTRHQGFINVISSEYLLKDYMAENASIFRTDAKAIPFIVPDYARTNRNTILKLVLMMSTSAVSEEQLIKEFSLLGLKSFDLQKQIWYELYCCSALISESATLPGEYRLAVAEAANRTLLVNGTPFSIDILKKKLVFNIEKGMPENVYCIEDRKFITDFVSGLQSAGYVTEDERGERSYLGAELRGHIYQRYLPGQFFTFGGKYYEMMYLTADGQVLLRRAADHISGRPSYRQIRTYTIHSTKPSEKIGSRKNVAGMRVFQEFADISVTTDGYYLMDQYNDFSGAKKVLFEDPVTRIPDRHYRNKSILRIELPAVDGKVDPNVRYTIALLFNEVFRTVFAEYQPFICALTDDSFLGETQFKPLTQFLKADTCELVDNCIYFIEDSQLDLGLTVAVERNLDRIFKIIHDYLTWHEEMLRQSINPPVDPRVPIVFTPDGDVDRQDKVSFLDKVKNFFKKLFKKKKPSDTDGADAKGEEEDVDLSGLSPKEQRKAKKKLKKEEKRKAKEEKRKAKEEKRKAKKEKKRRKGQEDEPETDNMGIPPEDDWPTDEEALPEDDIPADTEPEPAEEDIPTEEDILPEGDIPVEEPAFAEDEIPADEEPAPVEDDIPTEEDISPEEEAPVEKPAFAEDNSDDSEPTEREEGAPV